jgi:hypothetical protein
LGCGGSTAISFEQEEIEETEETEKVLVARRSPRGREWAGEKWGLWPAWMKSIAELFLREGESASGLHAHQCRADHRLRRQTPASGRPIAAAVSEQIQQPEDSNAEPCFHLPTPVPFAFL